MAKKAQKQQQQQQQPPKKQKQKQEQEQQQKEAVVPNVEPEQTEVMEDEEEDSLPKNFIARLDKKHNVAQKFFITAGALIVVPLVTMFSVYQVLVNPHTMEKPFSKEEAITYAGIAGVAMTIVIQVGYMMMALNEGKNEDDSEAGAESLEEKKRK